MCHASRWGWRICSAVEVLARAVDARSANGLYLNARQADLRTFVALPRNLGKRDIVFTELLDRLAAHFARARAIER